MNNITQLRDTINAAYRAVWYFRRSQDFYGIRWAHEALSRTRGVIESFAPAPQVALDNAALVVDSALRAADIVLTADYLEAGLLPPLLELQGEYIAEAGVPKPERSFFERNLHALFEEADGADIVAQVFGEAFAISAKETIIKTKKITDADWNEVQKLEKVLQGSGYTLEYTATGDVTLTFDGRYLHTNNTPVIEGLHWAARTGAASHKVFGAGLLYHIRGLQELYPGLHVELYETNPAVLALALLYAPVADMLSDGNIRLILADETEDADVLRRAFPEDAASAGTDSVARVHAPSVSILQDKSLREYLLRFGDKMGLTAGGSSKVCSIVIPCYNTEETIDRCLLSVIKQTIGIDQLEVICVDDASTDDTLSKLREWERRYPVSMKIIACKENGRQGRARNLGILHATTDEVFFLDADDWMEPETLEELVSIARLTGVEVVAATHGTDLGDGTLVNIEGYDGALNAPVFVKTQEDRLNLCRHGLHSNVWGKLYRREIFYKYDLFFPEGLVYEDNYFGPLLRYCIESYYVSDRAFYHWYNNPKSTGRKRNETYTFDRLDIGEMLFEESRRRGFLEGALAEDVRADFAQKYYLNSLHLFFTRFDEVPYAQIERVCRGLREHVPGIRETAWYQGRTETDRQLIALAFKETPKEQWGLVAVQYRDAVEKED